MAREECELALAKAPFFFCDLLVKPETLWAGSRWYVTCKIIVFPCLLADTSMHITNGPWPPSSQLWSACCGRRLLLTQPSGSKVCTKGKLCLLFLTWEISRHLASPLLLAFVLVFSARMHFMALNNRSAPVLIKSKIDWDAWVCPTWLHLLGHYISTSVSLSESLQRLRQSGAFVTSSEAALFELLGDSRHPNFKEVQALVKDAAPVL